MARKTAVPAEQLARLKDLYNQQRDALMELAAAEEAVGVAEETLAVAQQGLKEARGGVDTAYQAVVDLIGTAAAAELTGRRANGKRAATTGRKENETHGQDARDAAVPGVAR